MEIATGSASNLAANYNYFDDEDADKAFAKVSRGIADYDKLLSVSLDEEGTLVSLTGNQSVAIIKEHLDRFKSILSKKTRFEDMPGLVRAMNLPSIETPDQLRRFRKALKTTDPLRMMTARSLGIPGSITFKFYLKRHPSISLMKSLISSEVNVAAQFILDATEDALPGFRTIQALTAKEVVAYSKIKSATYIIDNTNNIEQEIKFVQDTYMDNEAASTFGLPTNSMLLESLGWDGRHTIESKPEYVFSTPGYGLIKFGVLSAAVGLSTVGAICTAVLPNEDTRRLEVDDVKRIYDDQFTIDDREVIGNYTNASVFSQVTNTFGAVNVNGLLNDNRYAAALTETVNK